MQEPMGVSSIFDEKAFLSALEWWQLAGVDEVIVEEPADWLAIAAPVQNQTSIGAIPAPAAGVPPMPAAPLPDQLPVFREWLMTSDALPETIPLTARIPLVGPEQAGLAVMVDMPETEDRQSGLLMSGQAGTLLDAMLRAIGRTREDIALLPLLPGRTPTGRPTESALDRWGEIGRHHLHLIGAKRVLLMGELVN